MTHEELKQIRLFRQHLTDQTDKITVVRDLCGIQCQFMSNAFHSLKIGEKKAFALSPLYAPMTAHDAKREQLRRYLTHIAPATLRDIAYFFKFTQAEIKFRLSELSALHFTLDGKEYFYLEPLKTNYPDIPPCLFLAGFDQLMLGYQKTDSIFLPQEYLRGIFNLAGIVMPAVMLNGTVAGKWKKKGKHLEITPFRTFSAKEKNTVSATAEALWGDEMGKLSFFETPLRGELSAKAN